MKRLLLASLLLGFIMARQEIINRKQFLNKLGLGTGAIMATYCLGGLKNCDEASIL